LHRSYSERLLLSCWSFPLVTCG